MRVRKYTKRRPMKTSLIYSIKPGGSASVHGAIKRNEYAVIYRASLFIVA